MVWRLRCTTVILNDVVTHGGRGDFVPNIGLALVPRLNGRLVRTVAIQMLGEF
jgi:hypothetical protein